VAIRIDLSDGCVGWGEAPMLPFVTAEDQSTAMVKAREACELLKDSPSMTLGLVLDILPGHEFASVCRIEGFSCFFGIRDLNYLNYLWFLLLVIYGFVNLVIACFIESFN
jgi:hypothetical protein